MYTRPPGAEEAFNVHLEHAKTTLLLISDYLRFRQEEDYEQMYNCLENITSFNSAKIETETIDKYLGWLERNKEHWCIKGEEGTVQKVNVQNKDKLAKIFKKTFRMIVSELHKKGITHKHKDDPAHAMARFDS